MSGRKGQGKCIKWLRDHLSYTHDYCLIWPFSRNPEKGYAQFGYLGKQTYAHRYMCELVNGPAPSSRHQAAHSCGNGQKGCVNPRHLSWKTNSENQYDRSRHGRRDRVRLIRVTPQMVADMRSLKGTMSTYDIARQFGLKIGCVEYWLSHDRPMTRPGDGPGTSRANGVPRRVA